MRNQLKSSSKISISFQFFIPNQISLREAFLPCVDEPFWNAATTKIFILPETHLQHQEITNFFQIFKGFKRLNVALLHKSESSLTVEILSFDSLQTKIDFVKPTSDVDVVFPDRLRDMRGYKYVVSCSTQFPRLFKVGNQFFGNEIEFMIIVAQKQNATLAMYQVNNSDANSVRNLNAL
jgi:hypothetical protein